MFKCGYGNYLFFVSNTQVDNKELKDSEVGVKKMRDIEDRKEEDKEMENKYI